MAGKMVTVIFWDGDESVKASISEKAKDMLESRAKRKNTRSVDILREIRFLFGNVTDQYIFDYLFLDSPAAS